MEWTMEWNSGKQNSLSTISFANEMAGSIRPGYWDPSYD